jgi:5-methylcytosine-specific restriction endonuclease McrA
MSRGSQHLRKGNHRLHKEARNKLLLLHPHCYWCNVLLTPTTATLDHVIPLSRGGTDDDNNHRLACAPCNRYRKAKKPGEGQVRYARHIRHGIHILKEEKRAITVWTLWDVVSTRVTKFPVGIGWIREFLDRYPVDTPLCASSSSKLGHSEMSSGQPVLSQPSSPSTPMPKSLG